MTLDAELVLDGYVETGNDLCRIRHDEPRGKIVVRCSPDKQLTKKLSEILDCSWDVDACRYHKNKKGDIWCCWMGPDERRIHCDIDKVSELCLSLEKAGSSSNQTVSCVDVSSQYEAIVLSGEKVREALSAVIALDLDDEIFTDGSIVGTVCLKVRVVLKRIGDEFYIFARRSEMHYLWRTFEIFIRSEHYE